MQGELDGKFGVVITLRPADKKLIVRLDGAEKKLAVLPPRAVEVAAAEERRERKRKKRRAEASKLSFEDEEAEADG